MAVGGGVIGDMVGFAAATFLRGVRLVHVPTTVMAQVDSAIGGKVGVNHSAGKNLIGAFHPPALVVADPDALVTLSRREFRAGLYEVLKYGVIADEALLDTIDTALPEILTQEGDALTDVVARCCRIKADIVSADEHEHGLRRTLNFGHTVGHALEATTGYGRLRHGEAVGLGMRAALALGVARGVTPPRAGRARLGADHAPGSVALGGRRSGGEHRRRNRPGQEGDQRPSALRAGRRRRRHHHGHGRDQPRVAGRARPARRRRALTAGCCRRRIRRCRDRRRASWR